MVVDPKTLNEFRHEDKYTIKIGKYSFRLRPEEKRALAKRSEDEDFYQAIFETEANDELSASLEYSVRFLSNGITQVWGIPESGKSTIAKSIIYELILLLEKQNKSPEIYLTYDYAQTVHEVAKFGTEHWDEKTESVIDNDRILIVFQDEQSNLQGPESRSYEVQLNTLMERFRAAQIFVFLVSPNLREFSVCNTFIEALAKDFDHKTNWGIWYVQKDKINKNGLTPYGLLLLELKEETESYFENYEQAKMKDIIKLMKRRGLQTIRIPPEVIDEGVKVLLKEGKKRKVRTKEQLKSLGNILGLGTSNTTKTINEIAALQFEIEKDLQKDIDDLELLEENLREAEKEKQRISKLVIEVAKDLYNKFDFINQKKAFTRLTKGYIIQQYPEDWQQLLKHRSSMWSLAEYWQNERISVDDIVENPKKLEHLTADRNLLRKALETAISKRNFTAQLSQRSSYYFIWNEGLTKKAWSIQKSMIQMKEDLDLKLNIGSMRKYFNDHKKNLLKIEQNNKIWGDAGELYLKYKILKIWEKGKTEGWVGQEVTLDLPCAAELRSRQTDGKNQKTDIYDLEIIINSVSAAAINVKFVHHEPREYKMEPESSHDNPWIFVIDKASLNEILIPSEKGKRYKYVNWGDSASLSIQDFLKGLIELQV